MEQNQGRAGFCSTVVSGGAHSKAANVPLAGSCTRLPSTPDFRTPLKTRYQPPAALRGAGERPPPRKARARRYGAGPARPSEPGGRGTRRSRGGGAGTTTTPTPGLSSAERERRDRGPRSVTDATTGDNGPSRLGRASLPLPLAPASQRRPAASERGGPE